MMRATLVMALVLTLPAAQAQVGQVGIDNPDSAAVALEIHVLGFQDFPMNTQLQRFDLKITVGTGLASSTLTCLPNPPIGGSPFQGYNTYYGYSSPSYVEYDFTENGRPRVAPERQMGYNATLDAGVPPILHWFLETEPRSPAATPAGDPPVILPNVVVQATVRASDHILSLDDKAYDLGTLLAHGRSPPALLALDQTVGAEHSMVDGHHIYGFSVPLTIDWAAIGGQGFTLRIDVFLDNPACATLGSGNIMPSLVVPYADAEHRPSITTGILDPLRITRLEPEFVGGDVVVQGAVQSVWGNYDVDEGNLSLAADGPTGHIALAPVKVLQLWHVYGHHDEPVRVTWVFNRTHAPPGLYWFNFTATNDQHTANATATAAVQLSPDHAFPATAQRTAIEPIHQAMPGPGLLAVLAAVIGAGSARSATVKRKKGG